MATSSAESTRVGNHAGSRVASVTIHRVMDTERGLGNVTGKIMLNTLLNHRSSTVASQALSEPIHEELFEIKDFDVVWLSRAYVSTLISGTRPGKQECLGKHWIPSVARRTPESVTVQEIFDECTTAHNELSRNRGFFPWQLLLGKTDRQVSLRKP